MRTLGAEEWSRLKEVFEAANALPAEGRPAYLAATCHDNPALRLDVEQLLTSPESAATLLKGPLAVLAGSVGTPRASVPPRIGRYLITHTLGQGGMGVVYAALDEQLDRPIAVKVLRHESADDPTARERFWREARLAASVNHPHICQLYEIGESDGQLFMAMERLDGQPLAARLSRGAVPISETVQIGLDVLGALEALHRRGVTHRDLKPSNVFLTAHGAKVLDFGVSLGQTRDVTGLPLTSPGAIVGTPKYMAPEQVLGNVATPSADLFAMGAILYEMLAGAAAFEADGVQAVFEKVLHGDVPTLAGSPAVAAADRVIHRALAKSPAQRYASAAAMAEDLRTALRAGPTEDSCAVRPVTRLMVLPFRLLRPDAEIDFLAISLADAVTNSLSPLESLVVRSTLAAARFASNTPDLKAIASEANVDVVLSGTLLRAGESLRVSAQLLEAPAGTVIWSHTAQVALGDIFHLQDTLARQIVESLALPLSGRERQTLGHDVPSNAKAYEFYLRANPLSHDPASWEVARDLYLQCLQSDPQYAPAWARLGRVYHVIGKYRGTSEDYARSESALNRALELNPDLSIADRFYAQLEIGDLGRAREAMVRLVRRASSRSSDPELFAALVPACRYCGLLQHSLAAYERAARLDPNIRTSVQHTFFMLGDYLRAAAEAERTWAPGSTWSLSLACAGHPDAQRVSEVEWERYANTPFRAKVLGVIEPDRAALRAAVDELIASGFRDPEGLFYQAVKLAHAGELDRAVEIFADVVDRGFYPYETLTRHAWLDPLRMRHDFAVVLQKAEHRHHEARADFVNAGGETLLGTEN